MRGELALPRQQRGAHFGDRSHNRRGAGDFLARQPRVAERCWIDLPCRLCRGFRIGGVAAATEDQERRRTVELASIEMSEAETFGQPARQGALAGSGGAINRDNKGSGFVHACSASPAPSRFIKGRKSGKLVAIGRASSIRTGSRAARPSTRKAIAIR